MYTPLEFVESRKTMLRVTNVSPTISQMLNDAIKEAILVSTRRSVWFEQLGDMYSEFWKSLATKLTARIGVEMYDLDLVQYVADTLIADEWSKYKIAYRKPTGEPKNKIREVLEYKVNTVNTKKSDVRYKYIDDGTPKRTVCSHYRNPHYQVYWVKVKGERVPELKWVNGMYINGRESKNVNVKRLANDN